MSRNCRAKGRCRYCGGKHHTTICDQADTSTGTHCSSPLFQNTSNGPNSKTEKALNPAATPYKTNSSTSCCHVSSDQAILLQVVKVTVFSPVEPNKRKEISAVLDTGSQKSYVTEFTTSELGILRKGQRVMSIMTFGSEEGKSQQCDIVEIGLELKGNQSRKLSVLTTPLICEPMVSMPAKVRIARYENPRSLELADNSTSHTLMKPELLIGMDYYWTFLSGELIQCADGLVALNTQFGWVLLGPMPECDIHKTLTPPIL